MDTVDLHDIIRQYVRTMTTDQMLAVAKSQNAEPDYREVAFQEWWEARKLELTGGCRCQGCDNWSVFDALSEEYRR